VIPEVVGDYPRIMRVSVRLPNGRRRWRLVKIPRPDREPGGSIFGLQAELARLTLRRDIAGHAIHVPATVTPAQRNRLIRWEPALEAMLARP